MKSITIIIPAYNEEGNLYELVSGLYKVLDNLDQLEWNIIIVNDGSTDNTLDLAKSLALEFSNILVLNNEKNLNLGLSYQRALQHVSSEFVSWIPADGEIPPSLFSELIPLSNSKSIVITYPTNSYTERPLNRYILSKVYRTIINLVFRLRVHYQNGVSIIPTKTLKKKTLISEGFTINLEILLKAKEDKLNIIQVPFQLKKRVFGASNAISLKKILRLLKTLLKLLHSY
ncbi:glycosyltransferase family 2 protein [Halobacteriovorax marinus]|uniref:glycosyltransferase family 2 protein n=1 Tax=Halobacteriovorax marinus TaxID=97084 RepID=UPI003A923F16